jgi:hypothetical protein
MFDVLVWIYLINATLLIVHEIDSAYWKEWELFRLPGGAGFFIALHVVLVLFFLVGLLWTFQGNTAGLVLSLVLGVCGVGAFTIHTWLIHNGHPEFKTPISRIILITTLITSLIQIVVTITKIFGD